MIRLSLTSLENLFRKVYRHLERMQSCRGAKFQVIYY